jgi:hypothetical protein
VACSQGGTCQGEKFYYQCGGVFPEDPPGPFSAGPTANPVFGYTATNQDISAQTFPTLGDVTSNLNTAQSIVSQGRVPVLLLGSMLLDSSGNLLPNAPRLLQNAINAYPAVFSQKQLLVEAVDEPFWNQALLQNSTALSQAVSQISSEIQLIRSLLPSAKVGFVAAPVWRSYPQIVQPMAQIAALSDWVGVDIYSQTLDQTGFQAAISLAQEFASYMKQNFPPSLSTYLIIQGFAPTQAPAPSSWTAAQTSSFEQYIASMFQIAKTQFNGVAIWGWGGVNELPDWASGRNFPASIKAFYASQAANY